MLNSKKSMELTFNAVVIGALAIAVLVVFLFILFKGGKTISDASGCGLYNCVNPAAKDDAHKSCKADEIESLQSCEVEGENKEKLQGRCCTKSPI